MYDNNNKTIYKWYFFLNWRTKYKYARFNYCKFYIIRYIFVTKILLKLFIHKE